MKLRDRITVSLIKEKDITNPTVIIGFQGVGLVGTLASQHLADNLDCELIGHIESEYLPPIAILHKNGLTFPIRIYYNEENNLIIISSEVPVSSEFAFEMSHDITGLLKKFEAGKIFVLEGLVSKKEEPDHEKVYGVPTNDEMREYLEEKNIEIIKDGAMLGVAGSILLTNTDKNLDSCALMAESHTKLPDALAASRIIKKLNEILGFEVDTEELEKKGDEMEEKIKNIIRTMKNYKTSEDSKILYG